jgi:hypothetical protein
MNLKNIKYYKATIEDIDILKKNLLFSFTYFGKWT